MRCVYVRMWSKKVSGAHDTPGTARKSLSYHWAHYIITGPLLVGLFVSHVNQVHCVCVRVCVCVMHAVKVALTLCIGDLSTAAHLARKSNTSGCYGNQNSPAHPNDVVPVKGAEELCAGFICGDTRRLEQQQSCDIM